MAKKRLKRADLSPGPRLDFFDYLQDLVLRRGDPSVAEIAKGAGYSNQAVYKALTGPKMPSRQMVQRLVGHLAGDVAVAEAIELWVSGVAEERVDHTEKASPVRASSSAQPSLPELTRREEEVLREYAFGAGAKEIALQLGLSEYTVRTHIKNVRAKYESAGFPARTRQEIRRQALHRGLVPELSDPTDR